MIRFTIEPQGKAYVFTDGSHTSPCYTTEHEAAREAIVMAQSLNVPYSLTYTEERFAL